MPSPIASQHEDYLVPRLSRHVDLANSHLLEIGCGSGHLAEVLAPKVRLYTGIDIDPRALREARNLYGLLPNVYFRYANAEAIDAGNVLFDVVLYGLSFHMIRDRQKSLQESLQVLKPSGIVAVLDPREDATTWSDPLLRRDSPQFSPDILERKILDIRQASSFLEEQKLLDVVEYDENPAISKNLWILRKR